MKRCLRIPDVSKRGNKMMLCVVISVTVKQIHYSISINGVGLSLCDREDVNGRVLLSAIQNDLKP
jgi:hypothetical protein